MNDVSVPICQTAGYSNFAQRSRVAFLLGAIGGAGVIGGMWLPLANLAGMGSVGCFDYNHARACACIALASFVVVFSIARCFRLVLAVAGVLGGLLTATGIDLYQVLRDVTGTNDGELAQMARQLIAQSSLQAGAYILPLCGVACVVAGMLGCSPRRPTSALTSEL